MENRSARSNGSPCCCLVISSLFAMPAAANSPSFRTLWLSAVPWIVDAVLDHKLRSMENRCSSGIPAGPVISDYVRILDYTSAKKYLSLRAWFWLNIHPIQGYSQQICNCCTHSWHCKSLCHVTQSKPWHHLSYATQQILPLDMSVQPIRLTPKVPGELGLVSLAQCWNISRILATHQCQKNSRFQVLKQP